MNIFAWPLFRTMDRVTLIELMSGVAEGVALFTFVFLLKRLFDLTDLLVSGGATLANIVLLLFSILPSVMIQTLPMAVLLASMMVYGRMVQDNEYIALQAVGYSPKQLLAPAIAAGLICMTLLGWWTYRIAPLGLMQFSAIATDILRESAATGIRPGGFTPLGPFVLYPSEVDDGGELRNLRMFEQRHGRIAGVIASPHATIRFSPEQNQLSLILNNGNLLQIPHPERDVVIHYGVMDFSISVPRLLRRFASTGREEYGMLGTELSERRLYLIERYRELGDYEDYKMVRRIELEQARRHALPAASLLMAILGALLGMWSGLGKRSSCYGMTILMIFTYYILLSFGKTYTEMGIISAWVGAWIPNAAAMLLGSYLFWRVQRI